VPGIEGCRVTIVQRANAEIRRGDRTAGTNWRAMLVATAAVTALASPLRAAETPPATEMARLFSLVGDYPLGEATSRADYQSFDPTSSRLYIAKMGSGKLLAFDAARNSLIAERDGFPKVTGVLVVPELHRVYASVPGAGSCRPSSSDWAWRAYPMGGPQFPCSTVKTFTRSQGCRAASSLTG